MCLGRRRPNLLCVLHLLTRCRCKCKKHKIFCSKEKELRRSKSMASSPSLAEGALSASRGGDVDGWAPVRPVQEVEIWHRNTS